MIETSRLYIRPLTYDELKLYAESEKDLADKLGYAPSAIGIDEATRDAILNTLLPNLKNLKNDFEFSTMWIIIEKKKLCIIGGICFHGLPDENDIVEIGYGIDADNRNNGYITETIKGLIEWTRKNTNVKTIKAETENSNTPSFKVLEKNGFKLSDKKEDLYIWYLEL